MPMLFSGTIDGIIRGRLWYRAGLPALQRESVLLRASRTGRYRRQRQSSSQVAWPDSVITIDDVLKADDRFSKHRTESLWRDVMRKVCTELLFVDVVRKGCVNGLCERFVLRGVMAGVVFCVSTQFRFGPRLQRLSAMALHSAPVTQY